MLGALGPVLLKGVGLGNEQMKKQHSKADTPNCAALLGSNRKGASREYPPGLSTPVGRRR